MSISELIGQYGGRYLQALFVSLELTAIAFVLALVIGVIITVMRVAPIKPLNIVAEIYVQIFRNIPGAALLILLVYALPTVNVVLSYFMCVLIAATLIPSSFCSEYLMSGMNTIGRGQIEAARSLGMRFSQIVRIVVLPQAVRSTVLPLTNLLVATMLTTSLAALVPVHPEDLTGIVDYINTHSVGGVSAFVISAFFYVAVAVLIGQLGTRLDEKVKILR